MIRTGVVHLELPSHRPADDQLCSSGTKRKGQKGVRNEWRCPRGFTGFLKAPGKDHGEARITGTQARITGTHEFVFWRLKNQANFAGNSVTSSSKWDFAAGQRRRSNLSSDFQKSSVRFSRSGHPWCAKSLQGCQRPIQENGPKPRTLGWAREEVRSVKQSIVIDARSTARLTAAEVAALVPDRPKQNSAIREPRGGLDSGACSISSDGHRSDSAGQPRC